MGVRELKKEKTKKDIIISASELFYKKGFAETTLEEIAEKAFIGVGTLYNYFSGKAELFLAVMAHRISPGNIRAGYSGDVSKKKNPDLTLDFVRESARSFTGISKQLWKEVLSAAFSQGTGEDSLMSGLLILDKELIKRLEECLLEEKKCGNLPGPFNTTAAALVLYSTIFTLFLFYINDPGMSAEELMADIEAKVSFILGRKNKQKR